MPEASLAPNNEGEQINLGDRSRNYHYGFTGLIKTTKTSMIYLLKVVENLQRKLVAGSVDVGILNLSEAGAPLKPVIFAH